MSEEVRREASVPTQSRVDIRTLAELSQYFVDGGVRVSTVSQLVSWSLEVLVETLRRNERIGEKPTIEAAYQYLDEERLMQRGMRSRKLLMARGWEVLRMEGEDPRIVAAGDHKSIHNNPNWTGRTPKLQAGVEKSSSGVDWEKIQERIREEERKEAREQLEKSMERIRETGQIDESSMSEEGGVITSTGKGSSVVYQEDMDAYNEREESREEAEQDEKSMKALEKLEEMALERIHLKEMKEDGEPGGENREDKEGESGGRDSGSDGVESDGTDARGDSLQTR